MKKEFRVWDREFCVMLYAQEIKNTIRLGFDGNVYFPDNVPAKGMVVMQKVGVQDILGEDLFEKDIVNVAGVGLCEVGMSSAFGVTLTSLKDPLDVRDWHDVYPEGDMERKVGNIFEDEWIRVEEITNI